MVLFDMQLHPQTIYTHLMQKPKTLFRCVDPKHKCGHIFGTRFSLPTCTFSVKKKWR